MADMTTPNLARVVAALRSALRPLESPYGESTGGPDGWFPEPEAIEEWEQTFREHASPANVALLLDALPVWRPIETAPKDGTDIMLSNGDVVTEGHWMHDEGGTTEYRDSDGRWIGQDDRDGFDGWIDWHGGMIPEPTHWQPLPAPPITKGPAA